MSARFPGVHCGSWAGGEEPWRGSEPGIQETNGLPANGSAHRLGLSLTRDRFWDMIPQWPISTPFPRTSMRLVTPRTMKQPFPERTRSHPVVPSAESALITQRFKSDRSTPRIDHRRCRSKRRDGGHENGIVRCLVPWIASGHYLMASYTRRGGMFKNSNLVRTMGKYWSRWTFRWFSVWKQV